MPSPNADLRDQFAMAALSGLVTLPTSPTTLDQTARQAYALADAMLEMRASLPPPAIWLAMTTETTPQT